MLSAALIVVGVLLSSGLRTESEEFEKPRALAAGDGLIDVDIGHAAPFVIDFDEDGRKDLLVGQFGEGKLRIYRNVGTSSEPRFDGFEWLRVGGSVARVPAG